MSTLAKHVWVTGGCGFIGSSLAISIRKKNPECKIYCLDNLYRIGSEYNKERILKNDILFINGDLRHFEELYAKLENIINGSHVISFVRPILTTF